ncbi:short-chain dehydrogenase [Actinoplanes sp. NBRC 14428]|uniref:NAD(P)-dependent dehydrogenase (Short-subunit alcohol dehydrogenase family) n=1 Tax=Pseudosporangium ferrugineum TaxID=439699 RepID=A0A2T0SF17_9ACTN|nr:SDR family oxidoreductase [Pseudosporangium ferrugineum]PRY32007.1 NAD(P)-dependent dehydrogenase (short-subunit alcohol dehydrogenase family) [Pseudosporangium ferrugineum]BCJ49754.1 short-chain dehydrogenase [Actinoplanes sp. NBRC 14428]
MTSRTALITGGTSGIGLATAALLHRGGYRVAVTGSTPESVGEARRKLPDDVLVRHADARSLAGTDRIVAEVRDRFGSLDLLFLNAGIMRARPVGEYDEATFDELIAVNFKGQFFTLQKALPLLNDGASVVFTVGIGATRGIVAGSAAAASRGALLALVPSLALELAPRRIRVNAVSPGAIATGLLAKLGVPAEAQEQMAARVPFGRLGTAEEVAEVVAFLGSPGAAYVTGENLVVGGGAGLSA